VTTDTLAASASNAAKRTAAVGLVHQRKREREREREREVCACWRRNKVLLEKVSHHARRGARTLTLEEHHYRNERREREREIERDREREKERERE
jgi:hypothetical protein